MRSVSRVAVSLLAGALSSAALVFAAEPLVPIAHSAQVTLAASTTPAGLMLQVRPTVAGAPLTVTGLSISVDGRSAAAARQADGSWLVPLPGARAAGGGKLEVLVAHDGIREVLSGAVPAAAAGAAATGVLRDHKQMAWWVLNIVIVLIAALAISRRMS